MFRAKAERKARELGIAPERLPPGQYVTEKWPVLHAGDVPELDLATWRLRVFGAVEQPLSLSYDELRALPQAEIVADIHCVTRWSRFDASFTGVRWAELAALARPTPEARFVVGHAPGYTANLPLDALQADDALVAWAADGEPLSPDHGWPVRLIVPSRYFWKSTKWLTGIELVPEDRPGFWERYGYHNDADPWREERYGF